MRQPERGVLKDVIREGGTAPSRHPVKGMTPPGTGVQPDCRIVADRSGKADQPWSTNSGINAMRHRFLAVLTASASFAMLLTSVHISLADVIDGGWCRAGGKRMEIHGPEIVTAGGDQPRGDY